MNAGSAAVASVSPMDWPRTCPVTDHKHARTTYLCGGDDALRVGWPRGFLFKIYKEVECVVLPVFIVNPLRRIEIWHDREVQGEDVLPGVRVVDTGFLYDFEFIGGLEG